MASVERRDGRLVWTPREARESTNGASPGSDPGGCSECGETDDTGAPAPGPGPAGGGDTGRCPQGPLQSAFAQAGTFVASGFRDRPTCPWAWAVLLGAVLTTLHMLTREG